MADTIKWCVTGATGQLGSVLVEQLALGGHDVLALSGTRRAQIAGVSTRSVDITDRKSVGDVLAEEGPTVIVHLAAIANAGVVLTDPQLGWRVNVDATAALVEQADRIGARFIHASTDLVFDGTNPPYDETSRPNPLSAYGRSKLESERPVLDYSRGVVARPALMFGLPAVPQSTTFCSQLIALRDGTELRLFEDEFRTPLWLADAARAITAIGRSDFVGLVHLAGPERVSRLEMGLAMAGGLGLPTSGIRAVSTSSMSFSEPRPTDVSLNGSLLHRLISDLPPLLGVGEATALIARDQLAQLC